MWFKGDVSCFICGQRFSILPVLTLDGIIAHDIIPGSVTSNLFVKFLREHVVCSTCLYCFLPWCWVLDSSYKSISWSSQRVDFRQLQYSSLRSRAAHRNRILRFVRYGCTGKTPVPSSPQTCELTAVILTAVNRIETVNFSRITASYGYTGACSVISWFWVQNICNLTFFSTVNLRI